MSFRLACKESLSNTSWSTWLDQAALDGQDRVLIDGQISALLRELGYSGDPCEEASSDSTESVPRADKAAPPGFEELVQIVRATSAATPLEFIRLVLASSQGEPLFVEVSEEPEFRSEFETAMREGCQALGMLGWEVKEEAAQAKNLLFPWHGDEETLTQLFNRLRDEGAESGEWKLERRSVH